MAWEKNWRINEWKTLETQKWDVLIIGGGITGAGILSECVNLGLKTLLVDANDFSFGTTSRSSKLIHGGLRYLRNRQYRVTFESVREREWMLKEADALITPLEFLIPLYQGKTSTFQMRLGVTLYDLFAGKWQHQYLDHQRLLFECPMLSKDQLAGGILYSDAQVDDSRMVMRILSEAVHKGGTAVNYTKAASYLRSRSGTICGAVLEDCSGENMGTLEVKAGVVINASGPWSDLVRGGINAPPRLRQLRGSHLVFSRQRIPINRAITLFHPKDGRALFFIPWEGITMIGTTDIDHQASLQENEPYAFREEITYLLEAANSLFPALSLDQSDIISTFAGIRPVINTGKAHPSQESRAHAVWEEDGLVTITGGKITTFRVMTRDVLNAIKNLVPVTSRFPSGKRIFNALPGELPENKLLETFVKYLAGRYGENLQVILATALPGELNLIETSPNCLAELRWAAAREAVNHLDDLLLRRVRLGLLLPNGGRSQLTNIRGVVQSELGWDDARWQAECQRYLKIWEAYYSPSPTGYLLDTIQ